MFHIADWTIKQNTVQNDYTGTIVGVQDPNKNNRAQIRIPYLHEGVPDEFLPWFKNGNVSGNTIHNSEIKLPVLGSTVKVVFENGDFYNGTFYEGYKNVQSNDEEFLQDYGTFDGHKDQWGNSFKTYANGDAIYVSNKGVTFHIQGTTLTLSGITQTVIHSDETIHNGNTTFNGNVTINGNTVHSGNIDTTGDINTNGNVTTIGNVTTNGDTTTNGNSTITGNNIVKGKNIDPSHRHRWGGLGDPTGGVL